MKAAGMVLVILGILALVYGGFSYTKETHDADLGPLKIQVKDKDRVNVPVWAGVAFPSSRFTRFRGARSRILQPTAAEPVNEISLTRSSSISTSPISPDEPQTTFSQPAGRPASSSSAARKSAESGV